jgi:hypothetical protein
MEHAKEAGKDEQSVVPKVHLHATHEKALDVVGLADLKKYAAESEAGNASNVAQSSNGGVGGAVQKSKEIGGKGQASWVDGDNK